MSKDILSDIDAAVDEARQTICGCGCQLPIPADGPSLYYAGPSCQSRAMRARNAGPEPVEPQLGETAMQRLEAILDGGPPTIHPRPGWGQRSTRPGTDEDTVDLADAVRQEQQRIRAEQHHQRRAYEQAFGVPQIRHMKTTPAGTATDGTDVTAYTDIMSYTRRCPLCRAVAEPVTRPGELAGVHGLPIDDADRIIQTCPGCLLRYPQPVLASWHYRNNLFSLTAQGHGMSATYFVTRRNLDRYQNPKRHIGLLWQQLTDDLILGRASRPDGDSLRPCAWVRPAVPPTEPAPAPAAPGWLQRINDLLARGPHHG